MRRDIAAAIVITAAILAGLAAIGNGGWPGEPSGCIEAGDCYCEAFTGGLVEQPANTFSNLGFVAVGLWVLTLAGRPAAGRNLIADDTRISRLYGWIAIGLGVGSMLFHGTMTEWGGWADLVSMYAFITFFLLYEVRTRRNAGAAWLLQIWIFANLVLATFQWFADNGIGKVVFAALIVGTLTANLRVVAPRSGPPRALRNQRLFWTGLAAYVVGNVIWMLSRTGGVLCEPDSILQGHAVWHLTSAAAVAVFFLYLRSEVPAEVRRG
ncbi:MAG: ceramidase [Acidimicrobiia bacterium]|nr:ceramidase [Acidimicrobiia bacterium]